MAIVHFQGEAPAQYNPVDLLSSGVKEEILESMRAMEVLENMNAVDGAHLIHLERYVGDILRMTSEKF